MTDEKLNEIRKRLDAWPLLSPLEAAHDYAGCYHHDVKVLLAEIDTLRAERRRLLSAAIRRSGASSWEEFTSYWDPTEETAEAAIVRLGREVERLKGEGKCS
jgi:hypothetical protein